mgnify:CR=1 FL=1
MGQFGQALMNVGQNLMNRAEEERRFKREMDYKSQQDAAQMSIEERKMELLQRWRESQIAASNAAAAASNSSNMKNLLDMRRPRRYQGGDTLFEDVATFDESGVPTGVKTTTTKLNPLMAPRQPKMARSTIMVNGVPTLVQFREDDPTNYTVVGEAPPKGTPEQPRFDGRTLDNTVSHWDRILTDVRSLERSEVKDYARSMGIITEDKATLLRDVQNRRDADVGRFSQAPGTTPQATSERASGSPLMGALEGVKALGSKVVQGAEQMTPAATSLRLAEQVDTNGLDPQVAISTWRKMFPDKSFFITDPKTGKQVGHDATKPPVDGAEKDDAGNWWVLDKETGKYRPAYYE